MSGVEKARGVRGYSMIELIVVMGIIALMVAIAVPPMRSFYWGWQLKETVHKVSIMTQKARMRALTTRQPVTLTFSSPDAVNMTVTYQESYGGGSLGSSYKVESLRLAKSKGWIVMGWNDGTGNMDSLVLTFNSDGSVTSVPPGPADNQPPRIDVYDFRFTTSTDERVAPGYVRVTGRGSVQVGRINVGLVNHTMLNASYRNGYWGVLASHQEEVRRGVRTATSE